MVGEREKAARSEDFYIRRMELRYALAKYALIVPCIAALWLPLHGALPLAEALAGKHTEITWPLSLTFVLMLGRWEELLVAALIITELFALLSLLVVYPALAGSGSLIRRAPAGLWEQENKKSTRGGRAR